MATESARILVVDDDPTVLSALSRVLAHAGHKVSTARNGREALEVFGQGDVELIVSDVAMPEMDGLSLLRSVREKNEEVPVILLAGLPTADSAMGAVRYHATEYLPKPVTPEQLRDCVDRALALYRLAKVRRAALALHAGRQGAQEEPQRLSAAFDRALGSVFMVYQPIVSWSRRSVFGYEALVRSTEQTFPHPGALFDAAERLGRLPELGRRIRGKCGEPMARAAAHTSLFVNLHTRDLLDETLFGHDAALAPLSSRVIFEITERADLDQVRDVEHRIARLRAGGFRIAVDDIGAGYSGLNSFAIVRPDVVKVDITLVRGVDADPMKRKLVGALIELCDELGISVVSEGVETAAERDALIALGGDLFQGYLFARPSAPFAEPTF